MSDALDELLHLDIPANNDENDLIREETNNSLSFNCQDCESVFTRKYSLRIHQETYLKKSNKVKTHYGKNAHYVKRTKGKYRSLK